MTTFRIDWWFFFFSWRGYINRFSFFFIFIKSIHCTFQKESARNFLEYVLNKFECHFCNTYFFITFHYILWYAIITTIRNILTVVGAPNYNLFSGSSITFFNSLSLLLFVSLLSLSLPLVLLLLLADVVVSRMAFPDLDPHVVWKRINWSTTADSDDYHFPRRIRLQMMRKGEDR